MSSDDAGDLRGEQAEVVAGDHVRAAGRRVLLDRLPVGEDQEEQDDEHRDGDRRRTRLNAATPDGREQHAQDLLGGVGRRRDAVGREHGERGRDAEPLVLQLVGVERRPEQLVLAAGSGGSRAARPGPSRGTGPDRPSTAARPRPEGSWWSRRQSTSDLAARGGRATDLDADLARRTGLGARGGHRCRVYHARVEGVHACTWSWWVADGWAVELAGSLEKQGHTVAVVDKRKDAFRRLPDRLRRVPHRRVRLRPRHARGGRHQGGRGARRGDERRQLEHHVGPGRPRDLRGRAGRRPHLRPPPGRDLPAPRHPDRRHRLVDHRPGDPAAAARRAPGRLDRPEREGLASSSGTCPAAWAGQRLSGLDEPGRFIVAAVTRLGAARVAEPRPRRPGGRHPALHRRRRRARRAAGAPERPTTRRSTTDAGRGRRRRKRRRVHRQRRWSRTATRCSSSRRTPSRRGQAAHGRRPRDPRRRRVRGLDAEGGRPRALRRRRRGDRRRRGQPRRVAAGQAGVRGAAGHRPGQPPQEPVDVQRDLGRRHRGVDPAPHHRRWSTRP